MILLNNMDEQSNITKKDYQTLLTLLYPIAPHITEELNELYKLGKPLCKTEWPTYDNSKLSNETYQLVVQVDGKVRGKIEVSIDTSDEEMKENALAIDNVKKHIENKEIAKIVIVPKKLVSIVTK